MIVSVPARAEFSPAVSFVLVAAALENSWHNASVIADANNAAAFSSFPFLDHSGEAGCFRFGAEWMVHFEFAGACQAVVQVRIESAVAAVSQSAPAHTFLQVCLLRVHYRCFVFLPCHGGIDLCCRANFADQEWKHFHSPEQLCYYAHPGHQPVLHSFHLT